MLITILITGIIVCAFGWLNRWVGSAALLLYLQGKEYTLPTDEELEACIREVWFRVLKIKR